MKTEAEIRRHRDNLRVASASPCECVGVIHTLKCVQGGLMMTVAIGELTWALGEAPENEELVAHYEETAQQFANETPRATVRMIDGKMVLDDPDALEVITAVEKHNCRQTLLLHADRVRYFINRIAERGETAAECIIVVINVDSGVGAKVVADALMPDREAFRQEFRDKGQVPFARGLAMREGVQTMLDQMDSIAGEKLRGIQGVAVLVMDYGVCEVFDAVVGPFALRRLRATQGLSWSFLKRWKIW